MKIYCLFLFIVSFLLSSSLSSAQSVSKDGSKRASLVEVQKIEFLNIAKTTETIGRLVALDPIIVSAKVNQEVLKIHFQIGDDVKKNDLLVTLESKDILRNIKQITSELLLENRMLTLLKKQLELRVSKEIIFPSTGDKILEKFKSSLAFSNEISSFFILYSL